MSGGFGERLELMFHSLHHIQHVVAEFLGLADEVHEEDAFLIRVFFVVDVEYVSVAELVAEVVDFAFAVVSLHDFRRVGDLHLLEEGDHIVHGLGHELEHLVDLMKHTLFEVDMILRFSLESLGHIIAAVGDAFYLADDSEHTGDAHLTFRGEATLAHLVEIISDLDFHAVGDLLIFLKAVEG